MKELKVKVVEIPINQIEENVGQIPDVPANPRRITDEAFELLKKSIDESPEMKELDEVKVYPYNGKYIAIGGNHRTRAYKEMGWKKILCKVLPEDTPTVKLREYIMKENMQYAQNDPYKLQSWGKDELQDWGVDVPVMQSDLDMKDFFIEESSNHHMPQEGFKVTVTCPKSLSEKKDEIISLLKEVMKNYGGVKVG
jgi:uncharacterized ParB-like nuclease family protein